MRLSCKYFFVLNTMAYTTKVKIILSAIFDSSDQCLNYNKIKKLLLDNDINPDKSTIYRQLKSMEKKEVIYSQIINRNLTWSKISKKTHGHFVCIGCAKIICINLNDTIIEQVNQNYKNQINSVKNIQLLGECLNCA
jgi:Fe2+ or Zn2+ uptake regulation protein